MFGLFPNRHAYWLFTRLFFCFVLGFGFVCGLVCVCAFVWVFFVSCCCWFLHPQTRKLKKLFAFFKEKLECFLKWCRSRKCLGCSYIYWYIACIVVTYLLHLKESVGIIVRPIGDYPAVYSPVSFSHYKSLSVIHWLSEASYFLVSSVVVLLNDSIIIC